MKTSHQQKIPGPGASYHDWLSLHLEPTIDARESPSKIHLDLATADQQQEP